ncbi:hypothetical protein ACLMJK_003869 [Lecanora helva]
MPPNIHAFTDYEDYILWYFHHTIGLNFDQCALKLADLHGGYPAPHNRFNGWPVDDRNGSCCRIRFEELNKQEWTDEEMKALLIHVGSHIEWKDIVDYFDCDERLESVTVLQCQIQICKKRGDLRHLPFSKTEDGHLREMNNNFNFDYERIARNMISRDRQECEGRLRELGYQNPPVWTRLDERKLRDALGAFPGNLRFAWSVLGDKTLRQVCERYASL